MGSLRVALRFQRLVFRGHVHRLSIRTGREISAFTRYHHEAIADRIDAIARCIGGVGNCLHHLPAVTGGS